MGHTLSEKIIAKYAGKDAVVAGEYVVVKDFIGPIGYSFAGMNYPESLADNLAMMGMKIAKPENMIVNGDITPLRRRSMMSNRSKLCVLTARNTAS
jgi:hypothetical protein